MVLNLDKCIYRIPWIFFVFCNFVFTPTKCLFVEPVNRNIRLFLRCQSTGRKKKRNWFDGTTMCTVWISCYPSMQINLSPSPHVGNLYRSAARSLGLDLLANNIPLALLLFRKKKNPIHPSALYVQFGRNIYSKNWSFKHRERNARIAVGSIMTDVILFYLEGSEEYVLLLDGRDIMYMCYVYDVPTHYIVYGPEERGLSPSTPD